MSEEVRATKTQGEYVHERRRHLGLSQDTAAWLAGVAKSTFRNVEGDRVDEARTWGQIERALGWPPYSDRAAIRTGIDPVPLLSDVALGAVQRFVLSHNDRASAAYHHKTEAEAVERDSAMALDEARHIAAVGEDGPDGAQQAEYVRTAEATYASAVERLDRAIRDSEARRAMAETVRAEYHSLLESLAERRIGERQKWFLDEIYSYVHQYEFDIIARDISTITGTDVYSLLSFEVIANKDLPGPIPEKRPSRTVYHHSEEPGRTLSLALTLSGSALLNESDMQWISAQVSAFARTLAEAVVRGKLAAEGSQPTQGQEDNGRSRI